MSIVRAGMVGAALFVPSLPAHAASITLESLTTPIVVNATIKEAPKPIASGVGNTVASGQLWTGGDALGRDLANSFLAWCFDLIHPVRLGATYEYVAVDAPFSNSYLLAGADARVADLFNANYSTLDARNPIQAAGFQIAVWEVANDDDFNIGTGVFKASGNGANASEISSAATRFLTSASAFNGPAEWQTVFLETREKSGTQNLVTAKKLPDVAPVPVPAAAFLLLGGLAGLVALRRR